MSGSGISNAVGPAFPSAAEPWPQGGSASPTILNQFSAYRGGGIPPAVPPALQAPSFNPQTAWQEGVQLVERNTQSRLLFFHSTNTEAVARDLRQLIQQSGQPQTEVNVIVQAALAKLTPEDQTKVNQSLETSLSQPTLDSAGIQGVVQNLRSQATNPNLSQAAVGDAIGSQLRGLSTADRINVSEQLVESLSDLQLDNIGTPGLIALRRTLQGESAYRVDMEIARRAPSMIQVNGVTIVGEEVSPAALRNAVIQVAQLTRNPEVARAMQGYTIEIRPDDELISSQQVAARQFGTQADDAVGAANGLLASVNEKDLLEGYSIFHVLNHEFTHGLQSRLLEQLPPDDPRLLKLLNPGTRAVDHNEDGKITATDVIKTAFQQRIAKGDITSDDNYPNESEWLAEVGLSFLAQPGHAERRDAQWLYENDPAVFYLLRSLYGPSPQEGYAFGGAYTADAALARQQILYGGVRG